MLFRVSSIVPPYWCISVSLQFELLTQSNVRRLPHHCARIQRYYSVHVSALMRKTIAIELANIQPQSHLAFLAHPCYSPSVSNRTRYPEVPFPSMGEGQRRPRTRYGNGGEYTTAGAPADLSHFCLILSPSSPNPSHPCLISVASRQDSQLWDDTECPRMTHISRRNPLPGRFWPLPTCPRRRPVCRLTTAYR